MSKYTNEERTLRAWYVLTQATVMLTQAPVMRHERTSRNLPQILVHFLTDCEGQRREAPDTHCKNFRRFTIDVFSDEKHYFVSTIKAECGSVAPLITPFSSAAFPIFIMFLVDGNAASCYGTFSDLSSINITVLIKQLFAPLRVYH